MISSLYTVCLYAYAMNSPLIHSKHVIYYVSLSCMYIVSYIAINVIKPLLSSLKKLCIFIHKLVSEQVLLYEHAAT